MKLINPSDSRSTRVRATVAIASLALLAAGCGSSTDHPSGARSPKSVADGAYRYSACMRNHGVTNFPDPKVWSHGDQTQIAMVVPSTFAKAPQFKTAEQACHGLLPGPPTGPTAAQQQARERAMLAFARCLRGHGLSNFPDPTSQGQLTLEMIRAAGINLHAPDVLPAAKACIGVTHGLITPNDVARAVNGQQ